MQSELKKTRFGVRARTLVMLTASCLSNAGFSQTAYFADGYHGESMARHQNLDQRGGSSGLEQGSLSSPIQKRYGHNRQQ